MRYTALIFLLYVCTCSCRHTLLLTREQLPVADTVDRHPHQIHPLRWQRYELGHTPDTAPRPYVQPLHGVKTDVAALREDRDSIITDKGAFARRDIISYCNGKATYANVSRYTYLMGQHYDDLFGKYYSYDTATYVKKRPQDHPVFAKKLVAGNISIYGTTFHWQGIRKGAKVTNYATNYYIQKGASDTVVIFDSHTVNNIFQPGEKGWEYAQRFDKNKRMGLIGLAAGFAVFYAGGTLANSGYLSHRPVKGAIGTTIAVAGASTVFTSLVVLLRNHRNTLKAIAAYNDVLE